MRRLRARISLDIRLESDTSGVPSTPMVNRDGLTRSQLRALPPRVRHEEMKRQLQAITSANSEAITAEHRELHAELERYAQRQREAQERRRAEEAKQHRIERVRRVANAVCNFVLKACAVVIAVGTAYGIVSRLF